MSDKGVDSLMNQNNTPGATASSHRIAAVLFTLLAWLACLGLLGIQTYGELEKKLVSACANAINLSVIILPLLPPHSENSIEQNYKLMFNLIEILSVIAVTMVSCIFFLPLLVHKSLFAFVTFLYIVLLNSTNHY